MWHVAEVSGLRLETALIENVGTKTKSLDCRYHRDGCSTPARFRLRLVKEPHVYDCQSCDDHYDAIKLSLKKIAERYDQA